MASVTRTAEDNWRAQVYYKGKRRSKTFPTKREANRWASDMEDTMHSGNSEGPAIPPTTLVELFKRYAEEVSPTKRGEAAEVKRLTYIPKDHPVFKDIAALELPITDITSDHISRWKNTRLLDVTENTVLREKNLISNVFTMAVEWGLLEVSPFKGVSWPKEGEERERPISQNEIDMILLCLDDWDRVTKPTTGSHKVAAMWCLALETAMRQGEIKDLQPREVDLENGVIKLTEKRTKEVRKKMLALNSEAKRILKLCYCEGADNWFGISKKLAISGYFRTARINANIDDLVFHDSRHEAITRLSEKLSVMELSRQTGIRDLKILMRYYEKQADEFVSKLD